MWASILVTGAAVAVFSVLISGSAILHPRSDSPARADAIVVVAGARDDRYAYARRLAEEGVSESILVSRPADLNSKSAALIDRFCASGDFSSRGGLRVSAECFTPIVATTEGEATTATRIARDRGWRSLLVVTYWGHVSRVRIYFEQCFDGAVYVTETPEPNPMSRRHALLHETGGYVKAFFKPAC